MPPTIKIIAQSFKHAIIKKNKIVQIIITIKWDTYFQTKQSIEALYLARPDVTVKLVFAVCFGTGILTTTPSANNFSTKVLFTWNILIQKWKKLSNGGWLIFRKFGIQNINFQTLTFTSILVRPSSLMVGNTLKGRLTPSVIRYLPRHNCISRS